ncbi:hypothetical protein NSS79_07535 [Paenibacillus sp. FSL L8-0436]|uniref:phosphotransferase-like protein n=1 Tax=Paenibacillus sp. FSL L8-0436 TaxID=2954686 RepID=UPI003158DBB4
MNVIRNLTDNFITELDWIKVTLIQIFVTFMSVGVFCPLDELERREKERGDRRIGQAKEQLEFVHMEEAYDLKVDTFRDGLEGCVEKILQQMQAELE